MKKIIFIFIIFFLMTRFSYKSFNSENISFEFEVNTLEEDSSLVEIVGHLINDSNESISFITDRCHSFEGYLESKSEIFFPRLMMNCSVYKAKQHFIEAKSSLEFNIIVNKDIQKKDLNLNFIFIPIDKKVKADGKNKSYIINDLNLKTFIIKGVNITNKN